MDSVRILRDATKLFSVNIANGLVAMVFSAWLVRTITTTELALYPVWGLCSGLATSVSGFGFSMAQQRLIPRLLASGQEEEARAVSRQCLHVCAATAGMLAVLLVLFAPQLSSWLLKTREFAPVLRALAPALLIGAVGAQLGVQLQTTNQFGRLSLNGLAVGSLGIILAVPCYLLMGRMGLVVAMTVPSVAGFLMAFFPLRGFLVTAPARPCQLSHPLPLLRYSLPFYATSVVTFLNTNADSLLLAALAGPRRLAAYYVAYRFINYLFQFGNAGFKVLVVKVSRLQAEGVDRVAGSFTKSSRYLFLFLIPLAGVLAALAPTIIRLYAGARYADAAPILSLLCLYMLFFLLYSLHRFYVLNLAPPVATLRLQVITTTLTLGCTAVAVWRWGGLGAAGGQAAALAMATAVAYLVLRKHMPVRYDAPAIGVAVRALLPAAAVVALPQVLSTDPALAAAATGAAVPLFLAIYLRALSRTDHRLLGRFFPPKLWRLLLGLAFLGQGGGTAPNPPVAPKMTSPSPERNAP